MTPSGRLLERLRSQEIKLPEGTTIHRTYASRSQRTAGAWSWFALDPNGREALGCGLGSHWPVRVLLRAPRLLVTSGLRRGMYGAHDGGWNVDPYPPPRLTTEGRWVYDLGVGGPPES